MAQPEEIELHEAVLEYLTSTADMSIITMKTLKVVLEGRFGCDLEASKSVLKKSMHAFIDNLVGKDDDGESNGEQRNTLKRKQSEKLTFSNQIYLSVAHLLYIWKMNLFVVFLLQFST